MADVMGKVKIYLFLSVCVMLLNICVVITQSMDYDYSSIDKYDISKEYREMSREERHEYLLELNKGSNGEKGYWMGYSLTSKQQVYVFYNGKTMSIGDYEKFVSGEYDIISNPLNLDYSKHSDTSFVSDVAGSIGTSFLPFASFLVSTTFFLNAFPFNIIIGIVIGIISALQLYLIFAVILNHLPFFNI